MQRRVAMLRLLSTNKELADLTLSVGNDNSSMLRPDSLSKAEPELACRRGIVVETEPRRCSMRRILVAVTAALVFAGTFVAGAQTRLQPSGEQPTSPGSVPAR